MEEKNKLPEEKAAPEDKVIVFEEESETEDSEEEKFEETEEREEFEKKKENFKESIKVVKEEPEEEFKIEGIRVWRILTAVFAILLIISVFTHGFKFGGEPTGAAAAEEQKNTEPTPTAPTEVQRENVSVDDDPQKGPSNAKVTIIEFSDFQCPYCGNAEPIVKQILNTYGDKVRFVYRDFPLSFHENAQKASEAAEAAKEQGKFWEYHDKLYANQQALDIESLKKYAKELGLDTAKFNAELDSGKYEAEVKKDIQDGLNANVRGTPAFFINGRLISGAQPFENFKKVIDEELK